MSAPKNEEQQLELTAYAGNDTGFPHKGFFKKIWNVLKNTFKLYSGHDTFTQGAALSYYTAFSIAPLLLIVIAIAGLVLGQEAVQGEIKTQLQGFLGEKTAGEIQGFIKGAYQPGKGIWATIISVVLLLVGAIGVFDQLRKSLNTIWDIKATAKKPVVRYLINRIFSLTMILTLAFLLLISLLIQSALNVVAKHLHQYMESLSTLLLGVIDLAISLGLTSVLFMLIYKFMSDVKLKWRAVWFGAVFTSVLFALGKYLITLYLSHSRVGDTYGAGASVIIILAWVFYSSQIFFFGAEFTRALAIERGEPLHHKIKEGKPGNPQ